MKKRIKIQAKPPKGMSPTTRFKGEDRVLVYLLGRNLYYSLPNCSEPMVEII